MKTLITACALLVLVISTAGQEGATTSDPISGKWGSDSQPLLELKYDGKSKLSGMTIWRQGGRELSRAPIKKGTFDPKTSAFKLEGEARNPNDGATHPFVIEGRVEKDTATGTYQLGSEKGQFTFKRLQ
jgi:hypothetical protein